MRILISIALFLKLVDFYPNTDLGPKYEDMEKRPNTDLDPRMKTLNSHLRLKYTNKKDII